MHILTYAVLDYIDNQPLLFVVNLVKILDDDIFLHTCCQTLFIVWSFFAKLQESCRNSAIHRWRHHSGPNVKVLLSLCTTNFNRLNDFKKCMNTLSLFISFSQWESVEQFCFCFKIGCWTDSFHLLFRIKAQRIKS